MRGSYSTIKSRSKN